MTNFLKSWQIEVRCPQNFSRGPWPWISDQGLVGLVAGSGYKIIERWGRIFWVLAARPSDVLEG